LRRRGIVAAVLVLAAVALAGSWFGWGREGLKPVESASPNASDINQLYAFIGAFAVLVFLSVMIPLALILGRYRERGLARDAEGPQVRGNTRLELLWTVLPTIIVVVISAFSLYKALGVNDQARAAEEDAPDLQVAVEGRQFYWRYVYPNGAVAIDRLRVPVDTDVELDLTAPDHDVQHSWWAPALQGKLDAIPGVHNELRFKPTRVGLYDGRCGELCGIQHAAMLLSVEVLPRQEYEAWVEQAGEQAESGSEELGRAQWEGVCLKCHFAAPEYAPSLAGNPLPGNGDAVRQFATQGAGRMPAVGKGWTEGGLDALVAYLRTMAPNQEEDDGS